MPMVFDLQPWHIHLNPSFPKLFRNSNNIFICSNQKLNSCIGESGCKLPMSIERGDKAHQFSILLLSLVIGQQFIIALISYIIVNNS